MEKWENSQNCKGSLLSSINAKNISNHTIKANLSYCITEIVDRQQKYL